MRHPKKVAVLKETLRGHSELRECPPFFCTAQPIMVETPLRYSSSLPTMVETSLRYSSSLPTTVETSLRYSSAAIPKMCVANYWVKICLPAGGSSQMD